MRKHLATLALGFAAVPLLAYACGGDEDASAPSKDAGLEATILSEAQADGGDAMPGPQAPCGDRSAFSAGSPWPIAGGCPKRGNVADGVGPTEATIKWTAPIAAGATAPVIGGDRLVWVGTSDGDIRGLDGSGAVAFTTRAAGPVRASGAVLGSGIVVLGSSDGTLYGVAKGAAVADAGADADADADGGDAGPAAARVAFAKKLAPITASINVLADGTLLVPTNDGKLLGLAGDASSTKWTATTNDTAGSTPAIGSDGTIYVASSDKKLYAFGNDGSSKWSADIGAAATLGAVVGGDETIYACTSDGKLHAVTPEGKERWVYATGGAITGAPAVDASTVYVGSDDKKLHAVAVATGMGRWQYATLGAVATPVVDVAGDVYVGSADGHVYAVSKGGSLLFAVNARGSVTTAPALSDDGVMFVTTSNAVLAIGP